MLRNNLYRNMVSRPPAQQGVGSAARLIPFAVVFLFVAASCGGYGVQLYQQAGAAAASMTFALSGTLALIALSMIVFAVRAIRAGYRMEHGMGQSTTRRRRW